MADQPIWVPDNRLLMPSLFEPGRKPDGPVLLNESHDLSKGMVAYWGMNDPRTGNEIVGGYDWEMIGGGQLPVEGVELGNRLLNFELSQTTSAETKSVIPLSPGTGDFTLIAWHFSSPDHTRSVNDYSYAMGFAGQSVLGLKHGSTGGNWLHYNGAFHSSGEALADSTYYCLILSRQAGVTSLYRNGILDTSYADALDITTSTISHGNWEDGVSNTGGGGFFAQAVMERGVSQAEALEYYQNPYQFLKPAIDVPLALYYGVADGAITGTGDLDAASAVIDGSAAVGHVGTGDLDATAAVVSGSGLINHTATGDLAATSAVVDGSGALGDEWEGTGDLVAASAELAGSGLINHVGSGALIADAATLISSASIVYSASGALDADSAVISGAGEVRPQITGTGELIAMPATLRGREEAEAVGQRSSLMMALGVPWRST